MRASAGAGGPKETQIRSRPVTGDQIKIRVSLGVTAESESDCFTSERASAGAFFGRPRERAFFII